MKPQLSGALKRLQKPGDEAASSLQEELVAAIHGAFEVAVEIAVREVTKLVGQATGDVLDEMRRENESLKQRLQRAEALLDSVGMEERGGGASPLLSATDEPHFKHFQKSPKPQRGKVYNCTGVRGASGHSRAQLPLPDTQEEKVCDGDPQHGSDAAPEKEGDGGCAGACVAVTKEEVGEEMSRVCGVRVESVDQPRQELAARGYDSPPLSSRDDESTLKQVTVKQEGDGSGCCFDSIKVEEFNLPCLSAVQSKMLEEWKPEVLDNDSQDSNSAPSCTTRLAQEFPNIFQQAEPAPIPEAPPQVHGAHMRTSRSLGHTFANLYTCKSCGQTFHLPSLLRRHYSQCQQRLQQSCKQPVGGGNRTRLQLYPPGCSPFRCTVCNREFNRMENLKTHFRIHTGERPYTCAVCSKCFRHSGALTRHFRIHTGEKPYICGQCGKSFTNCGGLKFHQRSHSKQLQ